MIDKTTAAPYNDYAQSANTLFHFMGKSEYLNDILKRRAIVPRYCIENIEYLNIRDGDTIYREAAVLQKCFCDIPFHKLMDVFELHIAEDPEEALTAEERFNLKMKNTHPDCYGRYAIALSKKWGETHHLLPIQYINEDSTYIKNYSKLFACLYDMDEPPDNYVEDILSRLSFMKPLRGIMDRTFVRDNGKIDIIKIFKNFHDEREWRYVPDGEAMSEFGFERVIANPNVLNMKPAVNEINKSISTEKYQKLWLNYDYNDIRYIVVPDSNARLDIINTILEIPDIKFSDPKQIPSEKQILISKILVLDEVRKDW